MKGGGVKLVMKDNAPEIEQFQGCEDCGRNKGGSMENNACLMCLRHYRHEARQEGFVDNFSPKGVRIVSHSV